MTNRHPYIGRNPKFNDDAEREMANDIARTTSAATSPLGGGLCLCASGSASLA
jgi:hypothetical protein